MEQRRISACALVRTLFRVNSHTGVNFNALWRSASVKVHLIAKMNIFRYKPRCIARHGSINFVDAIDGNFAKPLEIYSAAC